MSCLICFEKFDDSKHLPLIVKQCGHSACQACLSYLFDNALKKPKKDLNCPFCNTPEFIPNDLKDMRKMFPVNFLFLQSLTSDEQKPKCDHPRLVQKFICLDYLCFIEISFNFSLS